MAHFDIPQVFVLEDTNTGVLETPLDNYFDCRDFSVFDPAGCSVPQDPSFCFLFTPDDIIYIQTNLIASVIEFFELDGTPQIIPFTQDGKTITIDGSNIPSFISCFYIKIDNECTYGYQRTLCPETTITIESSFNTKDGLGFDYTGDYSNYLRISGSFEFLSLRNEDSANSIGEIISRKEFERYTLRTDILPPSIARLVLNVLQGKNVKVNKDGFNYNTANLPERQTGVTFPITAILEKFVDKLNYC